MMTMRWCNSWASGWRSVMAGSLGGSGESRGLVGDGEQYLQARLPHFAAGDLGGADVQPHARQQLADRGLGEALVPFTVGRRDLRLLVLVQTQQHQPAAG